MSITLILDTKISMLLFLKSKYQEKVNSKEISVAEKEYYKVLLNEANESIEKELKRLSNEN